MCVITVTQTLAGVQNVQREYVLKMFIKNTMDRYLIRAGYSSTENCWIKTSIALRIHYAFSYTLPNTRINGIYNIMSTTRHSLRFSLQKTTVPLTAY